MRRLFFIISLVILLAGLLSPIPPPHFSPHSDKVMHFLGFGAVSLAARIAFIRTPGWLLWGVLLISAPLSELLQHTLMQPFRKFSWLDILANFSGVILAAIGWWLVTRLYRYWQAGKAN